MAISTAAALLGSAIIGGGASVLAGSKASKAAGKAADAQTRAAADANALQRYMYDTTRADQADWREAGKLGLAELQKGIASGFFSKPFTEADFRADPGYQFRVSEQENALSRLGAAGGMRLSGGAVKSALRYAGGLADQTYNDAYNRFNTDRTNIWNRYAGLAGIGQTANNAIGSAGQNYANQAGGNLLAAGNARASGYANQSAIQTGMIGNLANIGVNALGYAAQNPQWFTKATPQPQPYAGGSWVGGQFN